MLASRARLLRFNSAAAVSFVAILAVIIVGSFLLFGHAAGFFATTEVESGTKSTQAVQVADTSASGSSAVKFTGAATPPPSGDWVRPTAATTGHTGTLTPWGQSLTFTANNQTISNVDFGGSVTLTGSNITLDNCQFTTLIFFGPGPLTIKNCDATSGGVHVDSYYRDVTGVTIDHVHMYLEDADGIDLFSNTTTGGLIRDVTIVDTLVDGQTFPSSSTAHGDGLQVRGIDGLTVLRTVFDMYTVGGVQSQKNAAIYFEDVYGGDRNMHFTNVDLIGGDPYNHTFYTNVVYDSTATNVAIKRGGYVTRATPSGWVFTNVTGPSGSLISP
jgi:hypothetical protein